MEAFVTVSPPASKTRDTSDWRHTRYVSFSRNDFGSNRTMAVDLEEAVVRYRAWTDSTVGDMCPVYCAANRGVTPDWFDGHALDFLRATEEGQLFLEYVVSQYLGITQRVLNLDPPEGRIDQVRENEIIDASAWQPCDEYDDPRCSEIDVQARVSALVEDDANRYIYTLELVDALQQGFYYAGSTKYIEERLQEHVEVGGTFNEAERRRSDPSVLAIRDIVPATDTSKKDVIESLKESVHDPVYGQT